MLLLFRKNPSHPWVIAIPAFVLVVIMLEQKFNGHCIQYLICWLLVKICSVRMPSFKNGFLRIAYRFWKWKQLVQFRRCEQILIGYLALCLVRLLDVADMCCDHQVLKTTTAWFLCWDDVRVTQKSMSERRRCWPLKTSADWRDRMSMNRWEHWSLINRWLEYWRVFDRWQQH